jgi:hypothetical protein
VERGSRDALHPPFWIGRNSPSIMGCRMTRASGLSGKSAGDASDEAEALVCVNTVEVMSAP